MSYNDGQVHLDFYDKDVDFTKIAGEFAEGDPLLQKCLLELWKNGINTTACCRGHNEKEPSYISLIVNNNSKMLIDATCEYIYLQERKMELSFCFGGKDYDTFTVYMCDDKVKSEYLTFLYTFLNTKKENNAFNNNILLYANYLSKFARQFGLICRYNIGSNEMMFGFSKPGYLQIFDKNAPRLWDLIMSIKETGNLPLMPISCDASSLEQFINIIYPNSFANHQDGIKK